LDLRRQVHQTVFYFTAIEPDRFVQLPIWFKPRFPMSAQVPAARVYAYYRPDDGVTPVAKTLTVRRASDVDEPRAH
jgi:hypothetical protein